MKLPKAHKNFSLAQATSGGITPVRRGEGDVRSGNFIEGIERPRRQKGRKAPQARPLITFGDLRFVLDRKWVAAQIAPINPDTEPIMSFEPANFDASKLRFHYGSSPAPTEDTTQGRSEPAGREVRARNARQPGCRNQRDRERRPRSESSPDNAHPRVETARAPGATGNQSAPAASNDDAEGSSAQPSRTQPITAADVKALAQPPPSSRY